MKKKYTKSEMYQIIEYWQESKLSQKEYCKQENIVYHTFKYWYRKYKVEQGLVKANTIKDNKNEFIPVEISSWSKQAFCNPDQIEVLFPNGVHMSCPVDMDIRKLKALLVV